MSSSKGLSAALLVLYILFSLPGIFVIFKHGVRHGAILGWFFLNGFFLLKIIASGLQLHDPTNTTAALLSNVGLSPLLLSTASIIHEARAYLFKDSRNRRIEILTVVVFHQLVAVAIALVASGASSLEEAKSEADVNKDEKNIKVGEVLLLVAWLVLTAVAIFTAVSVSGNSRSNREAATTYKKRDFAGGKMLIFAVVAAMPFLGIRLLTSLIYFFTNDAALNPVSGSLGLRVGLEIIEELIITLVYITAGILTRNIGKGENYVTPNGEPHLYREEYGGTQMA
ncbi:hypothetical protein F5Y16DRAFT_399975 [Xylariaceae sp. FL0255]|nr:hypothetical protein F5Y16DRAFT_399975 [Xylariaceae sp. FL0255]